MYKQLIKSEESSWYYIVPKVLRWMLVILVATKNNESILLYTNDTYLKDNFRSSPYTPASYIYIYQADQLCNIKFLAIYNLQKYL